MESKELLTLLLPQFVAENFIIASVEQTNSQIVFYLEENKTPPNLQEQFISYGLTEPTVIQDFPIRGKTVYLNIRRRKWQNKITGAIVTKQYNLAHPGTELTHELVAFLKGKN